MTLQSQTLPPPKTSRVSTIEFWRFVFTAMVCIYHLEIFFQAEGITGIRDKRSRILLRSSRFSHSDVRETGPRGKNGAGDDEAGARHGA